MIRLIMCVFLIFGIANAEDKKPSVKKAEAAPVVSQKSTDAATPKASAENTKPALFDTNYGDAPTFIKSDSLTLNATDRVFTYTGNVEVKQKDMIMTSANLEGHYDENNKIQSMEATKDVVITQGPDIRAKSQRAFFDQAKSILTLTENPELEQKGSILTADKIVIYVNENRSEALGTVQVKLVDDKTATAAKTDKPS